MSRAWSLICKDRFWILALLVIAFLLRFDFLISNHFIIDSDEAIVGLMAKHINEGKGVPTFYYGQHYMGSLEPLLVSLLFRVAGNTTLALQMVPLLFSLGLIILVYLIGMEIGSIFLARTAALLCAVPPTTLVIWSAKARGGFIEVVFLGSLAMLLTCRWLKMQEKDAWFTLLIGLVLGFGWWTNNQIIYFMLPIGCAMLLDLKNRARGAVPWLAAAGRHLVAGLVGFFFGGLPFWIYNFQHHFVSFDMLRGAGGAAILRQWEGVFEVALPIILGARRFWDTNDAFPFSTVIVGLLYAALLLIVIWARRARLIDLLRLRFDSEHPVELMILFLLSSVCVFAFSSFGWLAQAPRYLLPAYTGLFVLTAYAFEYLRERSPLLCTTGLSLLVACNLMSSYYGGRAIPGEPFVEYGERVSKDHSDLIAWLYSHDYHFVRTNYWIGYRLAFETGERIKFETASAPFCNRIPEYVEQVRRLPGESMPLVLVPAQAELVERALKILGYTYQREVHSGYVVIFGEHPIVENLVAVKRELMHPSASHKNDVAGQAMDGSMETRWGSGAHQQPGMRFEIALSEPLVLRGIRIDEGKWDTDYPRGLRVQFELENGSLMDLFNQDEYSTIQAYLFESQMPVRFYFQPVKARKVILTQTGEHPILDWSIAEIALYQ